MTWWAYLLLAVMVIGGLLIEYYERREIRRLRLYRDAARAAALRGKMIDESFQAAKTQKAMVAAARRKGGKDEKDK